MKITKYNFGDRLTRVIKAENYTKKKLSKESGIHYNTLVRLCTTNEKTRRRPYYPTIVALTNFFPKYALYLLGINKKYYKKQEIPNLSKSAVKPIVANKRI